MAGPPKTRNFIIFLFWLPHSFILSASSADCKFTFFFFSITRSRETGPKHKLFVGYAWPPFSYTNFKNVYLFFLKLNTRQSNKCTTEILREIKMEPWRDQVSSPTSISFIHEAAMSCCNLPCRIHIPYPYPHCVMSTRVRRGKQASPNIIALRQFWFGELLWQRAILPTCWINGQHFIACGCFRPHHWFLSDLLRRSPFLGEIKEKSVWDSIIDRFEKRLS